MRTTLKRGIGRGAAVTGNGRPVLPPGALSPITIYRQPEPAPRSGWAHAAHDLRLDARRAARGGRLDRRRRVSLVPRERRRSRRLDAGREDRCEAARRRAAGPAGDGPRHRLRPARRRGRGHEVALRHGHARPRRPGDQVRLAPLLSARPLRRDPLSWQGTFNARINGAYSECGTKGTLETVRALTDLPINYLITVNFRGFRKLVDAVGGIWLDVDRRYFNDRGGDYGFATINLFPGYQKLGGYQALDFVRYRHTDSDLYRVARQQLFVQAFKDQIKSSASPLDLPRIVKTITDNVEVGQGGSKEIDIKTVLRYALFAYSLPPGHFFQAKLEGIEETSGFDLLVPEENVQKAVQEFANPDVESPEKATAVALNEKPKPAAEQGTAAARDDDHGPQRQRRHRLGRNGQLSALAAQLPDDLPAGRQERERPQLGVLQDADPLRRGPAGRGGRGQAGGDALRHRRRRRRSILRSRHSRTERS